MIKLKQHHLLTIILILCISITATYALTLKHSADINIVAGTIYKESTDPVVVKTATTNTQAKSPITQTKTIVEKDETIDGKSLNTYSTITSTIVTNNDGTIASTTNHIEDQVKGTGSTTQDVSVVDRTIVFKAGLTAPANGDFTSITQDPANVEKTIITVSKKNSDGKIINQPVTQEFKSGETPKFSKRQLFPVGYQGDNESASSCKKISKDAYIRESHVDDNSHVCTTNNSVDVAVFSFNKSGNLLERYTPPTLMDMPHRKTYVCCVPQLPIIKKANNACGKVNLTNKKGDGRSSRIATCNTNASSSCITDHYINSPDFIATYGSMTTENTTLTDFIEANTNDAKPCKTVDLTVSTLNPTISDGFCCPE